MPQLNGQDGFANPLTIDATGIAVNTFSYNTPTLTDSTNTGVAPLWYGPTIIRHTCKVEPQARGILI